MMHPRILFGLLLILYAAPGAWAYSVLTHEAIIDASWADHIQPHLLKRFPASSPEDLKQAHAYAYGGAIIQDLGYYPFGSRFFSDLTHYSRSGDFVRNLIAASTDLNEYAFALGSLAHYAGDNQGHREATNKAIAMMYPKLKSRFGNIITYADDALSHAKVEFSFDVVQVAQGNYAPEAYHDFIGFEVAQKCLEKAFVKTYSLELSSLLHEDLAIGTYRYTVSSILPTMTKAAWRLKRKEIQATQPSATKRKFIYNLSRSGYRKTWGKNYEKPGFSARALAFLFRLVPKAGPLRAFAFQAPSAQVELLFMNSVNQTLTEYRQLLAAQGRGVLKLANQNFDTGEPVKPGKYRLADEAYAKLVARLNGKAIDPEVRADILEFYSDPQAPIATKRDEKLWKKLLSELDTLKAQE